MLYLSKAIINNFHFESWLCSMSKHEKRAKLLSMVEDWKTSGLTQKAYSLFAGDQYGYLEKLGR